MSDPIDHSFGLSPDEFEIVRQLAIRLFDVLLVDGTHERVFAHFHDAGQSPAGHLSFVLIDSAGKQCIARVISVERWRDLRDETAMDPATTRARAILAGTQVLATEVPHSDDDEDDESTSASSRRVH